MIDDRGLELSSRNEAAVTAFNAAIKNFLEYRLATMALAKDAVAADPSFAMAHCLLGYLFMGRRGFDRTTR